MKVREAEEQTRSARSEAEEARTQARETQAQLSQAQDKVRAAQRLAKVLAVFAVLAALAAGVVLSQRKSVSPDLAKTSTEPVLQSALSTNQLDSEQIRLALQEARDLDSLAARVPQEKISETLNLAATILADPQRSRFQEQLLDVWVKTDAPAAVRSRISTGHLRLAGH